MADDLTIAKLVEHFRKERERVANENRDLRQRLETMQKTEDAASEHWGLIWGDLNRLMDILRIPRYGVRDSDTHTLMVAEVLPAVEALINQGAKA